jgi:hypothetical protein
MRNASAQVMGKQQVACQHGLIANLLADQLLRRDQEV